MGVLWIIVLIAGILVEAATFSLVSIWFSVGALAAFIACKLGFGVTAQMLVFALVSLLSLALTRPLVRKIMPKGYIPTNGELDIGKSAEVIEKLDVKAGTGRVRIGGIDWGAVSDDGSVIEAGTSVVVVAKNGNYVTVKKS